MKPAEPAVKLFKQLARLIQAFLMYPDGNERQRKFAQMFLEEFRQFGKPYRISFMGSDVVVERQTIDDPSPVELLLIKILRANDWEGVQIEKEIREEGLVDLARKLVAGTPPPIEGQGYDVGYLTFESARTASAPVSNAVVGYLSLLDGARDTLEEVSQGNVEGMNRAREIVSGFAGQLAEGKDLFSPIRNLKHFDEYTFTHGLNVAILSMAAANALGVPRETVEALSMGALCHDVGKERIPKEILHKPDRLTDAEMAIMERHPVEGAKILVNLPPEQTPSIVPVIAYEHHMGVAGGGYPAALHGQKVHPASALVAIADVFDALRTVRPYRPARSTQEAFTIVLADARRGRLDRRLLPAFARVLGLSAKGTAVRLTDNREAVILAENLKNPLRPLLKTAEGEEVDLEQEPQLGIAGFFDRPSASSL